MYFFQTENIHSYSEVLDALHSDFGNAYLHTILVWCRILKGKDEDNCHWQVYLVQEGDRTIGICGLYGLEENSTTELWLGWFGILPEIRSSGHGAKVLAELKDIARSLGCKTLRSYVDKDGKPLPFYHRNGFTTVGTVKEFVRSHGLNISDFESPQDFVIECQL